jgi:polyisoprenoid-binding protein YceI
MRFASPEIRGADSSIILVGDLTIRNVTRRVVGLQGEQRIGFSGRTSLRRSEFGVGASSVEGSKVVVGDTVGVEPDIQADLVP